MAYVDPNQATPAPAVPTTAAQAPVAAGGQGVGGATKAAPTTPGQNVPAQPSAQLSAYLAANQPQSAAFAGNVASTVGGQVQAAGQAIQPAVNTYTGGLYSVPTDAAVNAAVAKAPSSLTPDQAATYQTELGAAAKAPNPAGTFETTAPYQDVTAGIQAAVEQAGLWNSGNSVPNLTTALAPYEGPHATAGDKTLDALLLSQTPEAYQQIQAAVAPAAGLSGQLAAGTTAADAALQSAIAADTAATPAAQGAATTYAKSLTDYLNQSLAAGQAYQTNQANAGNSIRNDAAAGDITEADAAALGYPSTPTASFATDVNLLNSDINANGGYGGKISPIMLSDYLNSSAPPVSAANLATPQNYSDVAALLALMGNNAVPLPLDPSTASLAGTGANYNQGALLNAPGLQAALTGAQTAAQGLPQNATGITDVNSYIAALLAILNPASVPPPVAPPPGGYTTLPDPGTTTPPGAGYQAI